MQSLPGSGSPELPSSFQSMESYKEYTSALFIEKFKAFIDEFSRYDGEELLSQKERESLVQAAQATVATRGKGMEAWQALQAFRQCLKDEETPRHLEHITVLAVAYYAEFAAYEILDDLPMSDYDKQRRGGPALWKWYEQKNGKEHAQESAVFFAWMLSTFANHLIHDTDLDEEAKKAIATDLRLISPKVLAGQSIHMNAEDYKAPDALEKTLRTHDLKGALFSANAMKGAAIAAGGDKATVAQMSKLGRVLGRLGQIINDVHPDDIAHDIERQSPNIVAASSYGNTQEGIIKTVEIFKHLQQEAWTIIQGFEQPNRHLILFLKQQEQRFKDKISMTAGRTKNIPYARNH
jgi:geranylgeranyl pyrophosphate synthase